MLQPSDPNEVSAELFGRRVSFRDLSEAFSPAFATTLAAAWQRANEFEKPQPSEKRLREIKRLLLWMANNTGTPLIGSTVDLLRSNKGLEIAERDWRDSVDAFCGKLRDLNCFEVAPTQNVLTRRSSIHFLSAGIRQLADAAVWPAAGPLKGVGRGQLSGGNIPSLCELTRGQKKQKIFPAPPPKGGLIDLAELSSQRLVALRRICADRLLEYYAVFRRGQDLMLRRDLPAPSTFERALETRRMRSLMSVLPRDRAGQLGGLLLFINTLRQNRVFVRIEAYPMQVLVADLGGAEHVVRSLEGNIDALIMAYMIVLIDTGFDINACDNLPADPFVGTVKSGRYRIATISATKARAGGKVVEGVLLDGEHDLQVKVPGQSLSGVAALKIWIEMSEPLRNRARLEGSSAADSLWPQASGSLNQGSIKVCDATAFKSAWNRFLDSIKDDPDIGDLPIQRRMIRPTVLQLRSRSADFEHTAPQAIANHSRSGLTMRYLGTAWFKAELAKRIREFQTLLEAAFVSDIAEVAERLGLSTSELIARQSTAFDTGLGFLCLDSVRRAQSREPEGGECTAVDACVSCPMRRFIPTSEGLIALVIFNEALKLQSEKFKAGNPERWAEVWLPYLALTEAVIEGLQNSAYRGKLRSAQTIAAARLEAREAAHPHLW